MASPLLQIVLIVSEPKTNPDNIDSAMRASLCRSRTSALDRPDSPRHIRCVSIAGRPPYSQRGCFASVLHCPSERVKAPLGYRRFRRVFKKPSRQRANQSEEGIQGESLTRCGRSDIRRICKTGRRRPPSDNAGRKLVFRAQIGATLPGSSAQSDWLPPSWAEVTCTSGIMIREHCSPGHHCLNRLIPGFVGVCQTFDCQRARDYDVPPRASQES